MAIRTNATLVKAIMAPGNDYDLRKNPDLTRFIRMANILTDKVVLCGANKVAARLISADYVLTGSELTELEGLLAAHFYQQSDEGYTSRSTAGASGSFQGKTDKKLEASMYGQSALLLDTSGCLEMFDKRKFAGAAWGGKTRGEALTAEERDI